MTLDIAELSRAAVVDAGARYGMHPSWRAYLGFGAPVRYHAFEPDAEEAARLDAAKPGDWFHTHAVALMDADGPRTLNLTRHRALSSFLEPDLTSECFATKPGQAEIDARVDVPCRTIASIMADAGERVDFIKIDTEATEYEVVLGAAPLFADQVLAIRSSTNFLRCYHDQKIFSDLHAFLLESDFILLNIDYAGHGAPKRGLWRKPDPYAAEDARYGVLVATDAVWIRRSAWMYERYGDGVEAEISAMKFGLFCMANGAADVGVDAIIDHAERAGAPLGAATSDTALFHATRLAMARHLGRWRTTPDAEWRRVNGLFERCFGEALADGHGYFPQIQAWSALQPPI